jgi:hypothetical protein
VHVTATAEPDSSQVVVSVLDDGRGMPPELVAAPFEPARRPRTSNGSSTNSTSNGSSTNSTSNGSSRKSAGAGLGLSIAKGIMQAHGGRIELIPLRQGTCFSVYLPVEAEVPDGIKMTGPRAIRGPADLVTAARLEASHGTQGSGNDARRKDKDKDKDKDNDNDSNDSKDSKDKDNVNGSNDKDSDSGSGSGSDD